MLPFAEQTKVESACCLCVNNACSGNASIQQTRMVCDHLTAPHLKAKEAPGGDSVLIACCDEAQVPALRLEGLQLPA